MMQLEKITSWINHALITHYFIISPHSPIDSFLFFKIILFLESRDLNNKVVSNYYCRTFLLSQGQGGI